MTERDTNPPAFSLAQQALIQQVITQRQSTPKLIEPAPTPDQLKGLLDLALTAPDHHRLKPWRFVVVEGEQRQQLGELFAEAIKAEALTATSVPVSDIELNKVQQHPLRAPMIIIVQTLALEHPKVPPQELLLSTGAAVQNMLLGLESMGFGAIWRTGAMAESTYLKAKLGFAAEDTIAGFIYIGTPEKKPPARPSIDLKNFVTTLDQLLDETSNA